MNESARILKRTRSLLMGDEYAQALAECDAYLSLDPEDLDFIILKSEILSSPLPEINDTALAISTLEDACMLQPEEVRLYEALGHAHEASGDYGRAAYWYKAAIALDATRAGAYYSLASLLDAPGVDMKIDDAADYLASAARLVPDDWQVHRDLATLRWRQGDLGGAEAEYELALRSKPPPARFSEGQILGWLRKVHQGAPFEVGYQTVLKSGSSPESEGE